MEIRPAELKDVPSLIEIENDCFLLPWKEKDILYELNENPVNVMYVLEDNNYVIGFIDFWITFDSATIAQIGIRKN